VHFAPDSADKLCLVPEVHAPVLGINLGEASPNIDAHHHGSCASWARESRSVAYRHDQGRALPDLHERGSRLHLNFSTLTSQKTLR
jgi:hypothetical protein